MSASSFPQRIQNFVTSREGVEFCTQLAITGLACRWIGNNPLIPNKNHLIVAGIVSIFAREAIERLFDQYAKPYFIHHPNLLRNWTGRQLGPITCLKFALCNIATISLVFYRFRPLPLELPSFLMTMGCLNVAGGFYWIAYHLSYFILPPK